MNILGWLFMLCEDALCTQEEREQSICFLVSIINLSVMFFSHQQAAMLGRDSSILDAYQHNGVVKWHV